ncbi:hypothetical protein FLAG1_07447 [Fusarium langsethiae]|uniref:Uncharacterized protein n=1 Tax=Fusarium langsethiae TaxID=179993 RepID=A0A0N0DDH8_FUSLA|nr:hypothetical protein FLAG1_07447 [Fusarium langsethiae]
MDNGEADHAFTAQGITYNTGQRHRIPHQVIPIRNSKASQLSTEDLARLGMTLSKVGFGDKKSKPADNTDNLALIVGKCLLRPASEIRSPICCTTCSKSEMMIAWLVSLSS